MEALLYEEPALLDAIVAFLPVATACLHDKRPSRPLTDHLRNLFALCRAFPLLAKRVGPPNEKFWRTLVLRHFDFTTAYREEDVFYVTADWIHITYDLIRSRKPIVGFPPPEDRSWILFAMYDFESSNGHSITNMLGEFPEWWPSIGAYFRSTEYGFLHRIQCGKATEDSWPQHEDAFTLYCDLMLLKERVAEFDTLEAHGTEGSKALPIFMGRMREQEITGYGYAMLLHCHISPFFWTGLPPVSAKWSGLHHPLPLQPEVTRTQEEDEIFPRTPSGPHTFVALRRLVHESFDDWRRIHVNFDQSAQYQQSPEFYIGSSRKSGRWLGFVGESDRYARGACEDVDIK